MANDPICRVPLRVDSLVFGQRTVSGFLGLFGQLRLEGARFDRPFRTCAVRRDVPIGTQGLFLWFVRERFVVVNHEIALFRHAREDFYGANFSVRCDLRFLFDNDLVGADRLRRLCGVFLVLVASVSDRVVVIRVVFFFARASAPLVRLGRVTLTIRSVNARVRARVERCATVDRFHRREGCFQFVLR